SGECRLRRVERPGRLHDRLEDRQRDPGTGLAGAERAAGLAGIVVADPDRDRDVVAEANEPGVVLLVAGAGLAADVGRVLSDRTRGAARDHALQHALELKERRPVGQRARREAVVMAV